MRQQTFRTHLPCAPKGGARSFRAVSRVTVVVAAASLVQGCSTGAQSLSGPDLSVHGRPALARQRLAPVRHARPARPARAGRGYYKIGKPDYLRGGRYFPRHEPDYDRTGIASWYGGQFHGRQTANGEIYDMNAITAAHPTLPLPSLVRVTNLDNGRQLVVRVNDRGPYARNRLIDLSRRSAEILGMRRQGTARVRVQYLGRARLGGHAAAPALRRPRIRTASLSRAMPVPTRSVTGGASQNIVWTASSRCLAPHLRRVIATVAANYGRVRVNSTCRSPLHNRRIGGARRSYHLSGDAADIRVYGNWPEARRYLRRVVGGYKHYGGGRFHIDIGPRRQF